MRHQTSCASLLGPNRLRSVVISARAPPQEQLVTRQRTAERHHSRPMEPQPEPQPEPQTAQAQELQPEPLDAAGPAAQGPPMAPPPAPHAQRPPARHHYSPAAAPAPPPAQRGGQREAARARRASNAYVDAVSDRLHARAPDAGAAAPPPQDMGALRLGRRAAARRCKYAEPDIPCPYGCTPYRAACHSFARAGVCRRGDSCLYAHCAPGHDVTGRPLRAPPDAGRHGGGFGPPPVTLRPQILTSAEHGVRQEAGSSSTERTRTRRRRT